MKKWRNKCNSMAEVQSRSSGCYTCYAKIKQYFEKQSMYVLFYDTTPIKKGETQK